MITPEYLRKLRELCGAATPGPWVFDESCDVFAGSQDENGEFSCRVCTMPYSPDYHPDLRFIAASREAIPLLLEEIEPRLFIAPREEAIKELMDKLLALTKERDALRKEVRELRGNLSAS